MMTIIIHHRCGSLMMSDDGDNIYIKNMKWFDKDLKQLRFNLINYGKIYIKFPKDPVVKNHFNKLYREYNKQRKYKCKSYKENTL